MRLQNILQSKKWTVRFYKYMLSYILFVVILLSIVGAVVYSRFITTLRSEVETSNIAALTQIKAIIDLRIKEMKKISLQISTNPQLTSFFLNNGAGYASYCAIRELNDYRANNGFIYDIALYYSKHSNIHAASGTYTIDLFFDIYQYNDWGKSDFLNTINTLKYPLMRPVESVNLNGSHPTGFATFLYPIPVASTHPYGAVIFLIEESVLKSIVKDILKDYTGLIIILDQENHPILSVPSGEIIDIEQKVVDLIKTEDISEQIGKMSIQGKQYSIVKSVSSFNGWQYLTVMPTAQFMQKVRASYLAFNLTVIGVLLLGIVMSFFFANNSYRPLRKLVDILRGRSDESANQAYTDEIAYISDTIFQVTKENQGLMSRLKNKAGMIKEQLLLRLLYGRIQAGDQLDDMLEISGIKLTEPYLAVVLLLIDDYEKFKESNTQSMQDILRFSMVNTTEELCAEIGHGYGMDLVDNIGLVFLLNLRHNDNEQLRSFIQRVKVFFRDYFNITLTAGIGNIYSDLSSVSDSFNEARTAAYHRLIMGRDQIIFYRDLDDHNETRYYYPVEQEQQLVMAIKQGDGEQARKIINRIIGNLREQHTAPGTIQYVWFGIIVTIAKIVDEMGISTVECVGDRIEDLMALQFETLGSLEDRLGVLCVTASAYIEKHKKSRKTDLKEKIMAYVSANYSDNSLCVDRLAEVFALSPSYIARFFKDQTGYSLKQYIDLRRMDRIKVLLKTTNMTLKEIIGQVGYVDETNVIRKFKKSEGITPIQYRTIAK